MHQLGTQGRGQGNMEEDNAPAGDSGKRTRKHGGGQGASRVLREEDKEPWRLTRSQLSPTP